mmetsp:Transcript_40297/g.110950  ORF Transcript_40297/g.110950 Transcript_40297/m.110950 type:complete len:216 (+) Transcript_40297:1283-1930(+)
MYAPKSPASPPTNARSLERKKPEKRAPLSSALLVSRTASKAREPGAERNNASHLAADGTAEGPVAPTIAAQASFNNARSPRSRRTRRRSCTTGLTLALTHKLSSPSKRSINARATLRRHSSTSGGVSNLRSGSRPVRAADLPLPFGSGANPPSARSSARTACEAHASSMSAGHPPSSDKLLQTAAKESTGGRAPSARTSRSAQDANAASRTWEAY